ncbi:MAG: nucleotidyltransferase family protein [Candidatus Omnitrophica bacterium]|nr:nucleotidyltransferase family protein [Candidatus Omnitrophota bacterium]
MKALLLAAGLGIRLRPVTDNIPKCLVPIQGRPLLAYWLRLLIEGGCQPLLVNTHYFADKVEGYINGSEYRSCVKTVYEGELLGTGGTVLKNRSFFGCDPFMLIHADNLSQFDVRAFIARHEARPAGCAITMMTFATPTPESCGVVELDDQGVVQAFHEKVKNPPGNLANGAVYILEGSVFDFLESLNKSKIDFSTEVLPYYLGKIYTFHNDVYHRDIGTLESYILAEKEFIGRGDG